jgi:hypothetical protein
MVLMQYCAELLRQRFFIEFFACISYRYSLIPLPEISHPAASCHRSGGSIIHSMKTEVSA